MKNKDDRSKQTVELRIQAEEIARKKAAQASENLDAMSSKEMQQTLHELRVHQIELEIQNEELRRVQTNLDEMVERYFDFYNIAPVGYLTISKKGLIIEANLTIATFLGVEKATLIKKPFTNFILPVDQDLYYKYRKQNFITSIGTPQVCELRVVKKDGTHFWANLEIATVQDGNGEIVYRVVISDITESKKAYEEMQEGKAKIDCIFDSSPDAITVTDISGNIVECNQATLDSHGFSSKDEVLGKKAFMLIAEKDHQRATENMKEALEQGMIKNVEYTLCKKDKSEFIGELSASVMKDTHGKPIGFVAITKDISARKKNEEEIKKQNRELKKLDRMKTNFLNATSHELRTPMASIKGYVQMILKGKLGDVTTEERNALDIVLRNTNRLDHLVQDILDISILKSGSMKFIPEKTNIKDIVGEIVESINYKSLEKNITINTEIDENIPNVILDKERIRQVFINIIDNSFKFSPYGTTVTIRGKKQQKELLFEIQDQGRGIPKNHQEKIFSLFYQVDSGEDRKYGGAGLGLAIIKDIIDMHGGKVWVESTGEPGKGSIFKFTLPINSEDNFKKQTKRTDFF